MADRKISQNEMKFGKKLNRLLDRRARGYEDCLSFSEGVLYGWKSADLITAAEYKHLVRSFCMEDDEVDMTHIYGK